MVERLPPAPWPAPTRDPRAPAAPAAAAAPAAHNAEDGARPPAPPGDSPLAGLRAQTDPWPPLAGGGTALLAEAAAAARPRGQALAAPLVQASEVAPPLRPPPPQRPTGPQDPA